MTMNALLKDLHTLLPDSRLLLDEPMARHTTFRVGGPADAVALPETEEEVVALLELAKRHGIPCTVLGNGSNVIVRDKGVRGLVVLLGEDFAKIAVEESEITSQAGAPLARVAQAALTASLAGLEFASGIPGTVGGGAVMNAGAYGGQLSDVLTKARIYDGRSVRDWSREEMELGYRTSRPLREGFIVLSARFSLAFGDPEQIGDRMRELNARRRDKQPLNLPSAGSTFKRPEGYFAGKLIEDAGLKGLRVGGAQVSEKHAGFVVNTGGATAADILELIAQVQERVYAASGVSLETEVRVLGE